MGLLVTCDICQEVIKNTSSQILLGVYTVQGEDFDKELQEELKKVIQLGGEGDYGAVKVKTICAECLKVLNYFFNLRKEELEKSRKEVAKILTKKRTK